MVQGGTWTQGLGASAGTGTETQEARGGPGAAPAGRAKPCRRPAAGYRPVALVCTPSPAFISSYVIKAMATPGSTL